MRKLRNNSSAFLNREIWQDSVLRDTGLRGRLFALLRILSIILKGFSNNRLLSRSAALSYYSLISLGPLLAIVIMISGFFLRRNDANLAVNTLNRVLVFIAPSVSELAKLDNNSASSSDQTPSSAPPGYESGAEEGPVLNKDLVALITHIVDSARSGTVGVVGALLLIFIGIQLLTSIETTFNEIWGVRQGRGWFQRIVFYWTFISLGAIFGFASLTFISASTFLRIFDYLPFSEHFSRFLSLAGPFFSLLLITALLYGFYRLIPNTRVRWKPALVGALFVALLLLLNNYLSFLYVQRVISQKSLYGSLGIVPVLMIGLYVFWFFVLIGGQITYSIQNADTLTHQEAWENVSPRTRETLNLALFVLIARRFVQCEPAYDAVELGERIRVPGHILNESLNRLVDLGFISAIRAPEEGSDYSLRYQPARPLHKINLGAFREALEAYGNNAGADLIHEADPLLDYYRTGMEKLTESEFSQKSFASLLGEEGEG